MTWYSKFSILTQTLIIVFFICVFLSKNTVAQDSKQVLILHSYHQGLTWTDSITNGITSTFNESSVPIELHYEFMDTKRIFDEKHLENLQKTLHHKYRKQIFDVIVSSDDHAFRFLLNNQPTLFPDTPVVFCGVNGFDSQLIKNNNLFTGVIEELSFKETIEAAYTLAPDLEKVFAVVDSTVTGQSNKKQLIEAINKINKKPQLIFLEHRTMYEMQSVTADLPEKSILIYLAFTHDSAGQHFSLEEGANLINRNANKPMFSFWDFHIGHGVIGGKMTHGFTQGQTAANLAMRILQGEKPKDIPVMLESPNQFVFDHKVLRKFNLDKKPLPSESIIINQPETFLEQNKKLVLQFIGIIGGLIGVIVIISYNLIKLRIADKALKTSEERFREITELLPETIYEIDNNQHVTFLNKSGKEQFQITEDEIKKGLPFYELISDQEREIFNDRIKKIEAGIILGLQEYRGKRKNGEEFPIIARGMPIVRENTVAGIRGILIDISEKKEFENRIQHIQRMESLGTLAGGIAHDFNNLLVGIQGSASLALVQCEPDSNLTFHLKRINECSKSAANLTKQLLGVARSGKYDLKITNLNNLIKQTVDMFSRTKKELRLKQELQSDIWAVQIDRSQIEQVLLNLLINAWHAINGNGTITIETKNVSLNDSQIKGTSLKSGPHVQLKIIDTGSGIDPSIKDKIFDPFFTTKSRGRGTGLGLASSYGIIKNHMGNIEVDSHPGEGAQFTIYLPAQKTSLEDELLQNSGIQKGTETVLLVDDEEVVLKTTKELLKQLGYTVHIATSGEEAIRKTISMKDEIDLVLLDLIMPDMTGEKTFKELKIIKPDLKVLFCSGYSAYQHLPKVTSKDKTSFIQKPFDLQTLSTKIREVFR